MLERNYFLQGKVLFIVVAVSGKNSGSTTFFLADLDIYLRGLYIHFFDPNVLLPLNAQDKEMPVAGRD